MKKVDRLLKATPKNHIQGAGIDGRTAQEILVALDKTYNGNSNSTLVSIREHLSSGIEKDMGWGLELLWQWLNNKKLTWWINQDPEVRPLNNFSKHPISLYIDFTNEEINAYTTEAYFQASKFFQTDPDWAWEILDQENPAITKTMGNSRDHQLDPDWQKGMAVQRMLEALFAKYRQHQEVRDALSITTDKYIIERADWDPIWGDGPDGKGKNYLGKCWMFIRSVML